MNKIKPLSPIEIKQMPPDEIEKKANEIHQAVVIVHALFKSAEVYIDFLKYYQFIIDNQKFRKKINNSNLEVKMFLDDLDKFFKSQPDTKQHIEDQTEFSYSLLDELEKVVKDYTYKELGFTIEKQQTN